MSESATRSEIGQVLDGIKSMQAQIQSIDKKLDIHITRSNEQFNTVRAEIKAVDEKLTGEIKAVRTEIKTVDDKLSSQMKSLDDKLSTQMKSLDDKLSTQMGSLDDKLSTQVKCLDDKLTDLCDRQKTVDSRLWGFIVTLTGAIIAYLVKLSFFDPRV